MSNAQKPPNELTALELLERLRLAPNELERRVSNQALTEALSMIYQNGGPPPPEQMAAFLGSAWDSARVAGAMQMKRAIHTRIHTMADPTEPAPPLPPKYPPIMVVEEMDRHLCHDCEEEAS